MNKQVNLSRLSRKNYKKMVEFNEQYHKYLVDGLKVIPSVSELVKFATNENYKGIPQFILEKAADFGSEIHSAIELYLTKGEETIYFDDKLKNSYEEFMRLKDEFIGKTNIIEQIVSYKDRYAGRIDLLSGTNLIDFKTNAKYDEKLDTHLKWQLGYYKLALNQIGLNVDKCYCLYLPKTGKGKWVEIAPIEEYELLRNLNDYEQRARDY